MADEKKDIKDETTNKEIEKENKAESEDNTKDINKEQTGQTDKNDEENVTCENKNENAEKEKKEESKDELTITKEKVAELEDRYKRLLAEFDNFRKRSEKENIQMCDIGESMVLTKVLPIIDNLERALTSVTDDLKGNPFVEGVDKTYKQVMKTFEELQVKPIEALNKTFDPNLHNAVMTDETSEAEPETITEVLQKGYTFKDQVLRHAMVKVKK